MSDYCKGMAVGAATATVISWIFSLIVVSAIAGSYRDAAIEHGAARYHPQTGEFEWIDRAETGEQQ